MLKNAEKELKPYVYAGNDDYSDLSMPIEHGKKYVGALDPDMLEKGRVVFWIEAGGKKWFRMSYRSVEEFERKWKEL